MCGIAGHVTPGAGGRLNPAVLDSLAHRGPDASRTQACVLEGCSWELAFARLSILDLSSAGDQPMTNEDGSLVMVFNGEIYNSPELRQHCEERGHRFSSTMDGEVILHLWEMEGSGCLGRLNGIFALAIASTTTGELVIARDPVGVKPLVYVNGGNQGLWFASELSALRSAGAPIGRHDTVALAQFLSFLWIPDPRTPYENVRSLEPGTALRWTPSETGIFRYCPPLAPQEGASRASMRLEDAVEECEMRFTEAVRRQLLADVPIGLMASGGVDSGLIWSAASDELAIAYTVTWPGIDGRERLDEDTAAVRLLEQRFGTRTVYVDGTEVDDSLPISGDLFADPAQGLAGLIATRARQGGYKVLLAGQGGDELFAGYRRHRMAALLSRVRLGSAGRLISQALAATGSARMGVEYATRTLRALGEATPFRAYMQLCTYSNSVDRARILGCTEAEVTDDIVWQRHQEVYDALPHRLSFLRQAMAVDLAVYLPGLGLAYMDRAGMQHGIEVRVPWLDLDLIRWTLTLPDELLIRRGRGKWLPRAVAERRLSTHLAHRAKRGFAAPTERVRTTAGVEGGTRQIGYFKLAANRLRTFQASDHSPWPGDAANC